VLVTQGRRKASRIHRLGPMAVQRLRLLSMLVCPRCAEAALGQGGRNFGGL